MDFIAWCDQVLHTLAGLQRATPSARQYGVHEEQIAQGLYGDTLPPQPGFISSPQRRDMWIALVALEQVGLIATGQNGVLISATPEGRRHLDDPTPLWERQCSEHLDADQAVLLCAVNRLSVREESDHAWLEDIDQTEILHALSWDAAYTAAVTQELADQYRLIEWRGATEKSYPIRSTYHGLAWETRRGYTLDSRQIDALVAEWETTSVDFKRKLHTDTSDQKAELVKDVLGLANTQASGRRWMIIGFDDKTRAYYGPPDPKLTQNHLEQLLARYTKPVVLIRYDVVDYQRGKVGRLEVLRDPAALPYQVKQIVGGKGAGGKRMVEIDQIFVRHGSQTEEPSLDELQALYDEATYARSSRP
jgi:Schlafen, AlbA_2